MNIIPGRIYERRPNVKGPRILIEVVAVEQTRYGKEVVWKPLNRSGSQALLGHCLIETFKGSYRVAGLQGTLF